MQTYHHDAQSTYTSKQTQTQSTYDVIFKKQNSHSSKRTQLRIGYGIDGLLLVQVGRRGVAPLRKHAGGVLMVDVLEASLHKECAVPHMPR